MLATGSLATDQDFGAAWFVAASGKGKGVTWEGAIIKQAIYDAYSQTLKFVPIFSPRIKGRSSRNRFAATPITTPRPRTAIRISTTSCSNRRALIRAKSVR